MPEIDQSFELNANFSEKVVIRPKDYKWESSPMPGVDRMKLDRIGDEVARATSLVRYVPNSSFSPHQHSGGEEIFVLEGVFGDEHGMYPAGSYIRNPIGTAHQPVIGEEGATIFVKLHQFKADDQKQFVINTNEATWHPGLVYGLEVMPLHQHDGENIALVKWAPHTVFNPHKHWGGEEILVIKGTFYDEHGEYPEGSWLRSPHMSEHRPYTKDDGALIYVKVGHLTSD
ncbi:cupin domain-containing protein [Alphaproteobacteria bacterium]|nr:cupin domain-containing protein [Alphaproteobacteria bacterium]